MKKLGAALAAILAGLYILNPTMGVFELLPDNIPFIGNLDEAAATAILLWAVKTLGFMQHKEEMQSEVIDVKEEKESPLATLFKQMFSSKEKS